MEMSIMDDLDRHMAEVQPGPGESVESLARRLFDIQTEFYSAHVGSDLLNAHFNFDALPEKHREAWARAARRMLAT